MSAGTQTKVTERGTKTDAAHPSAHEKMGKGSLQHLPAFAPQPLSPLAPDPTALGVRGLPRGPACPSTSGGP